MYYLLRIVAMATMFVDHVGVCIYPDVDWFRGIGRIAYPLYVYGIWVGWHHTTDRMRYVLRLCGIAILAEPLFDIALYTNIVHNPRIWEQQNVIFGFVVSLLMLWIIERIMKYEKLGKFQQYGLCAILVGIVSYGTLMLNIEYYMITPLLLLACKKWKPWWVLCGYTGAMMLISLTTGDTPIPIWMWVLSLAAPVLVFLEKDRTVECDKGFKKFWTWFYPGHLCVLYAPELIATIFIITGNLYRWLTTSM